MSGGYMDGDSDFNPATADDDVIYIGTRKYIAEDSAEVGRLRERAEAAEKEVASSMREASALAMFLYLRFYREVSPDFELIEYPSGVLSQVDNMLAGVVQMLTAARRAALSSSPAQEAMRPETLSEHIARDIREGRFPQRSKRQMVPVSTAQE